MPHHNAIAIATPCVDVPYNNEARPDMSESQSHVSGNYCFPKYAGKLFLLKVETTNMFHHFRQKHTIEAMKEEILYDNIVELLRS